MPETTSRGNNLQNKNVISEIENDSNNAELQKKLDDALGMLAQAEKIVDKLATGARGQTLLQKLTAIEQQYQDMEEKQYQTDQENQSL